MSYSLKKKVTGSYYIPILLLNCLHVLAGGNKGIPAWLIEPGSVWGKETNGVCAVVSLRGGPGTEVVTVLLVASDTNANWKYVAPPDTKFTKLELRDTNGVVVTPLSGKKLDGNLAERILVRELPRFPDTGTRQRGSTVGLKGRLNAADEPATLHTFAIRDTYQIKDEGDYTLEVCPAIYQFGTNSQSVSRMDLPCVTTRIHLAPPQRQ